MASVSGQNKTGHRCSCQKQAFTHWFHFKDMASPQDPDELMGNLNFSVIVLSFLRI